MKIIIGILILSLSLMPLQAHALSGASVTKVIQGRFGTLARIGIVGVRTASTLKYVRYATSWVGLALMAGMLAIEYIPGLQDAWFDWLGLSGMNVDANGNPVIVTVARFDTAGEAAVASAVAWWQTNGGFVSTVNRYSTAALRTTAFNAFVAAHGSWSTASCNGSGVNVQCQALKNQYANPPVISMFFSPYGSGVYTPGGSTPATGQDLASIIAADLAGTNGTARQTAARAFWEKAEIELNKAVNGEAHDPLFDDLIDAYKEMLWNSIGQDAQDLLEADTDPAAGEDVSETDEVKDFGLLTILQNFWNWLIGETPATIENVGVVEGENVTALDSESVSTSMDTEKLVTVGLLDNIKGAFTGLNSKIMTRLNAILPSGVGTCSMSASILGKTVTISYCDFDFSVIRGVVIAMAGIAACVILIL